MKLLLIQNSLKTTWLFRKSYIENLLSKGVEVTILAFNDGDGYKENLEKLGVEVFAINSSNFLIRLFILNYNVLLNFGSKMDRIQCHFISTIIFSLPSLVVFSKKTSIVIEGLGSFCDSNKEVLKVLKFIFINFKFNRVFMNVDERNQLGKTTDTVLGGIGIDLEQYKLKLSPKNELETPRNNTLSIAYAGRLLKDKGINDVFKLLDICIENNIDVMLNVYGDIYKNNPSSLTQSDIEYLSEHFGEKVKFWGYCENLKESLIQNDLLVLPSKREGFPVVVMEASALGIPTIAYNVPGSQDAIINEVNGFLSPYGDVDELYRHVRYFVSLPDIEKEKLSLSAKKYAEDNFSRTIKNRDLYNSVLRK